MLSFSHTYASHHCCSPLIFRKKILSSILESNGKFLRLGQNATKIFVKERNSKACPYILQRFGRLYKFRVVSLENRPNSCSIFETLLSSSFITSFIEWQAPTIIEENIGNHGYIGTSILRIYRRYIGGYFGKKYR